MTVYYLLFLSFPVFYILFSKVAIWGNPKLIRACIYGVLIFCILAFRHPSMGVDLGYARSGGYLWSFQILSNFSFSEILNLQHFLHYEKGYILFNWLLSFLGNDYQILLIASAFLSVVPIMVLFYKESVSLELSYIIYLSLQSFIICFSGLRQGIAIGICMIAFLFIQKHDWKKFTALVLLASTFHGSAIFFLPAYPIFFVKISKSGRWYTLLSIIGVFLLKNPLYFLFSKIIKYNESIDNNGAITFFIIFTLVYVFSFLFASENEKNNGLLNLILLGCFCVAFSGILMLAVRVGYYYFNFLPLLLPIALKNIQLKYFKLLAQIVVTTCFLLFALYGLYIPSWAMTYPYKFFWE